MTRFEVPHACYSSTVRDGVLLRCRVGPHSADRGWPWWAPWDALEDPERGVLDGGHPTVTRSVCARPAPVVAVEGAVQLTLPYWP